MKSYIKSKLDYLHSCTKKLPKGKLTYSRTGKYYKLYASQGTEREYIPKSKIETARKLALQNFYSELQNIYEKMVRVEETAQSLEEELNSIYEKYSTAPFAELISASLSEWEKQPYEHNPSHPERLKIKTMQGCIVRTKSEALIANALYSARIPFRYECELKLGNISIFPDFTILHPITNEVVYLEHLGLLEKSDYREDFIRKIKLYINNGFFPGINLFFTSETEDRPLDQNQIDCIIQAICT